LKNTHIGKLLERYLLGRANPTDNTIVDNWYRSFDAEPVDLSAEEAEVIGRAIWEKIEPETLGGAEGPIAAPARVRRLPSWRRAAAAILLVAGAASGYLLLHNNRTPQFATITTGIGESKKITLEDGSVLTLDAGTTIRVQKDSKDRTIEIADGRVFFDVAKDDAHPFVIHTQELTTTVLGTSFTIAAYQGFHDLKVGVVTGRVKVQGVAATLVLLSRNEELSYDKSTKVFRTLALDESMTAWQEGRLLMNDITFAEMAVVMQKNFGVVITTTQDAVRQTKYTTELLRSMKADEAVEVLAAIHHLKIKKQDNKIILYK